MFLKSKMLFIYSETSMHVGAGSGLGAIDLPIQRERITDYPLIQASGLKGALRSVVPDGPEKDAIFGADNADNAGAIVVGDARILLFPVRSLVGVFAWVTSVDILQRFQRDAQLVGLTWLPSIPTELSGNNLFASGSAVLTENNPKRAVLEEFAFNATIDPMVTQWATNLANNVLPSLIIQNKDIYKYWQDKLKNSLLVLPNVAFRDFVKHSTEVVTRIRLDNNTKTVDGGGLWTEERLPSETVLYAPVNATQLRLPSTTSVPQSLIPEDKTLSGSKKSGAQAQKVLEWVSNNANVPHQLQIGGNETIGRGQVRLRWA